MHTILVIDDDEAVRRMVTLGLEKNRYHVLEASSGWEGMVVAREAQLDLILCDVNLGCASEREVVDALKRRAAADNISFILMTGQPQHGSPGEEVLGKPFTLAELLEHVRKQIKRRSRSGAAEARPKAEAKGTRHVREFGPPVDRAVPTDSFTPGLNLSREQLEHLLGRVQRLREEERTQVARAIHDDLTQTLTVLALELSFLESGLNSVNNPVNPQEYIPGVRKLAELVNALVRSAQEITAKLRPKVLDEFGFVAALEWLTNQVEQKTGLQCELLIEGTETKLEPGAAGGLYRLSEEILGYAARRAAGSKLLVQVANDGGKLRVKFTEAGTASGSSLWGEAGSLEVLAMAEQAERLGGVLDFSRNAGGTTLSVTIPAQR